MVTFLKAKNMQVKNSLNLDIKSQVNKKNLLLKYLCKEFWKLFKLSLQFLISEGRLLKSLA